MLMDYNEAKKVLTKYHVNPSKIVKRFFQSYKEKYFPLAIERAKIVNSISCVEVFNETLNKRQYNYYLDNLDIDAASWFLKYIDSENSIEKAIYDMLDELYPAKNWKFIYEIYYEDFSQNIPTPISWSVDRIISAIFVLVLYEIRSNKYC